MQKWKVQRMEQDKHRRRCQLFFGPEENYSIKRRRASA